MLEEVGVIVRVEGNLAVVKTKRSSMCSGCHSGGFCTALGGGSDMEVAAKNEVGGEVGDEVRVAVPSKAFLKASFLVYIVPVSALILGALLGRSLAPFLSQGGNFEFVSVVFGLMLFVLSFFVMRIWTSGAKRREQYSPVISEILYGKGNLHE
jgi:sigma-E factor negative regulatory protein RseC